MNIIFLKYDEEIKSAIQKIFFIEGEKLPQNILSEYEIECEYLNNIKVIDDLDNGKIFSFLMGAINDSLLILSQENFSKWSSFLLNRKRIKAFGIEVNSNNNFKHNWTLLNSGKIALPKDEALSIDIQPEIRAILLEKEEEIENSLLRLFQDSENIDAVHKIRVHSRTLRSLLDFLKPWTDRDTNKYLRNILRNLALSLSDIREEDVLIKEMKDYKIEYNLSYLGEIENAISESRKENMKNLLTKMISENTLSVVPILKSQLEILIITTTGHEINERYFNDMIDFEINESTHDYNDIEKTHDLRKEAKRMRYIMENFNAWIPSLNSEISNHFKDIQTLLGNLCDMRTNQDIFEGLKSEGASWNEDLDFLIELNKEQEEELMKSIS